jgi:hypothetical protein
MVLAKDGHECLSLAEKTVDDLLFENGISHEKEPHYPGAMYRADWKIVISGKEIYIELFGLDGQPNYMRRKTEKLLYAKQNGMELVTFERKDLADLRRAFINKVVILFPDQEKANTNGTV